MPTRTPGPPTCAGCRRRLDRDGIADPIGRLLRRVERSGRERLGDGDVHVPRPAGSTPRPPRDRRSPRAARAIADPVRTGRGSTAFRPRLVASPSRCFSARRPVTVPSSTGIPASRRIPTSSSAIVAGRFENHAERLRRPLPDVARDLQVAHVVRLALPRQGPRRTRRPRSPGRRGAPKLST